jgi:hypothetical protein
MAFVIVANLAIIATCFAVKGWNEIGAGSATRNTARFAIAFFLLGFASPALKRWMACWPGSTILLHMFAAALFVHFGAVALLHSTFVKSGLHLGIPEVIVVLVGVAVIGGIGLTAEPQPGKCIRSVIHVVLLYLIFFILFADYSQHPDKVLRWMVVPLVIALVLRHLPRKTINSRIASTAA